MTRSTSVNQLITGKEPKFSEELSKLDLIKTLTWYSQNKDSKDAAKYASDFLKKTHKLNVDSVIKSRPTTFGFICRILSNGGKLSAKDSQWFDSEIQKIKLEMKQVVSVIDVETNVPNIQDRIKEKASECIGELHGQIDEMITSNFSANVSPYAVMHTMDIKGVHVKPILNSIKTVRKTFDEVLHTKDDDLKEAYSNFTKPQIKKIIAWCDQAILDCQKISDTAVKSRKPRKRKVKSADQLVAKAIYMSEFKELNLKSISASDIIGTMQLWVYNTKTRKLGVYHATDAGGLSVKGSTIQNFNEIKSMQKTLRKPDVSLPEVLKAGKVALRNYLDGIRAVESKLTGRLNKDTILLRTVK